MKKILMIALDAAEPSLIEKWMEDGSLPALKRLRDRGAYGRLDSTAKWMAGSVWFSFASGKSPANHGLYNYLVWNAARSRTELPDPRTLPLQPFWEKFDLNGPRAIILDVPMRYQPAPFNGKEVVGWATDDRVVTACSYPPDFYGQLLVRFGEADQLGEREGSMSKKEFRQIRDRLLTLTDNLALMAGELIREEKWDLFLLCLPSLHRGGHKLWNANNIDQPLTEAERTELEDALHQIYMASDRAVDELTRDIDPQTTVMVFSLHGMGQNSCRTWVVPEMLRLILDDLPDPRQKAPRPTMLHRVRSLVPVRWRDWVKSALPLAGRHYLTGFWRTGLVRWDQILAFSMMADVQGWIRINLKGREAHGLVSPGAEYDALCAKIMEGLKSFVDADTGRPLVRDIFRADQVFKGDKLDWLPDIIAQWNDEPASSHRTITSARYGTFPWPVPGQNPEGRSGNHKPEGMLLVAGEGLKSGNIVNAHILDLAPTILAMLDQSKPQEMEGRVLPIFET